MNISLSRRGTSSLGAKREAIQNSRQAPTTRKVTIVMPSMPCDMASLPIGAISPHPAHAPNIERWAISARFLSCLSISFLNLRAKVHKNHVTTLLFSKNVGNAATQATKALFCPFSCRYRQKCVYLQQNSAHKLADKLRMECSQTFCEPYFFLSILM